MMAVIDAIDPLLKSLTVWLYGFIGCPPRHMAIEPTLVEGPQTNSVNALRKYIGQGF